MSEDIQSSDSSGNAGQSDSADMGAVQDKTKRRGIQSIEIGFSILEALRKAGGPIPLKKIAQSCDMPVANVHNYLVSFQKVGVVVQEADTGFYGLGQYALQLGTAVLQQFDIHKVARPAMAELGARTGFSVFLGVWGNKGPTIVYRVEHARSPPIMELRVGSVLQLLNSALGRNFTAHLPSQMTAALIREELKGLTGAEAKDAPKTAGEVEALCVKIREQGFSSCFVSWMEGYTTMSAPVFDQLGGMVAALTLMGPTDKVDLSPGSETVTLLKHYAGKVSAAAGWRA